MELKVSSLKPEGLSPADCVNNPEENEVSDEDDDDRNHKHRRRETHSQSSEMESVEPVFSRSYRKRNKPFENGHPFRQSESQASESWKNYYSSPLVKDFTTKFEKRHPSLVPLSRLPMDLNRPNQTFSGEPGHGRGRGRDPGSWRQFDSRFSSVDIASQIVQQGPVPSNLFARGGLANVSNPLNASWNAFGLIPGIPNGGLDTLHSIALQGTLRPPVNSSLNMAIPRQRCRDFEERGFCLRGDVCPMEHGVNRIVVEDVQSLSQFNLPVSLPSSQFAGTVAGPGPLPSVGAPSSSLMNSKATHGKSSKPVMVDDGLGLNVAYSSTNGADFYDPEQPLWNNHGPETSSGLLALHSPNNDETESLVSIDPSNRHHVGSQSTSSSVWGRIGTSKNKSDGKENFDSALSASYYLENESKEDKDALTNVQGAYRQGKRIITEDTGLRPMGSAGKTQSDSMRNIRKSSQKALRTLFVNDIPQKSNKRETLLSHFQKFGEVIDIYIPVNSKRAFVQFSKREEAEAALRAPDAVMGNRFIKLWWANRDSKPDDGISTSISVSVTPRGGTAASVLPHSSVGNSGKDDLQPATPKGTLVPPHDTYVPATDHQGDVLANGPKVPSPLRKKLESLEQLKEELRKKQELLAQKRSDFRRQLDKLEKQATGVKGEVVVEPSGKRHKVEILSDGAKATTPRGSDHSVGVASLCANILLDKCKQVENVVSSSPKTNMAAVQQEPTGSKQLIRPLVPVGLPFMMNRYKLDNLPTAFRIIPPLPAGLRNVTALKEHFLPYGDLYVVELEDAKSCDVDGANGSETSKNCSPCLTFTTRHTAEKAFLNGRCWEGNNLKFVWVTSSSSINDPCEKESSSSAPEDPVDADIQPVEESAYMDSQEASASRSGGHGNSGRDSGVDSLELHEVSQPYKASMSSEGESPKQESSPSPKQGHSPTSISGGEGSMQQEPCPTAMSGEKESPKGFVC